MPNIEELSRCSILERITYKAQAEGQTKDLSDFLLDKSFPQI